MPSAAWEANVGVGILSFAPYVVRSGPRQPTLSLLALCRVRPIWVLVRGRGVSPAVMDHGSWSGRL